MCQFLNFLKSNRIATSCFSASKAKNFTFLFCEAAFAASEIASSLFPPPVPPPINIKSFGDNPPNASSKKEIPNGTVFSFSYFAICSCNNALSETDLKKLNSFIVKLLWKDLL